MPLLPINLHYTETYFPGALNPSGFQGNNIIAYRIHFYVVLHSASLLHTVRNLQFRTVCARSETLQNFRNKRDACTLSEKNTSEIYFTNMANKTQSSKEINVVNYEVLIPILTQANNEQQQQIDDVR